MKINQLHISSLLVFFVLLTGCASHKAALKADDEAQAVQKTASGDMPGEVRVSEFILGPWDKIEIVVYRHDDLKRSAQIDKTGRIHYPLVGDLQAAGLSIFQLRDRIRDGLSKYIVDPQVSVGITSVQSQKVIVLGEVRTPGFFQIDTSLTALEAISRAGGFTNDGKKKSVLLIRGGMKKPDLLTLNLERALKDGDLTQNLALQNGDIIYVSKTFIANVDRFFNHLSTILSPILSMESGYFIGQQIIDKQGSSVSVPTQ